MSIQSLKDKLRTVPGIAGLTMSTVAGKQRFSLNGKTIEVPTTATDSEIAAALSPVWLAKLNEEQPKPVEKQIASRLKLMSLWRALGKYLMERQTNNSRHPNSRIRNERPKAPKCLRHQQKSNLWRGPTQRRRSTFSLAL